MRSVRIIKAGLNLAGFEVQMGKPDFLGAEPLKKRHPRETGPINHVHVNISYTIQVSLNACGFRRRRRWNSEENSQEGFI